MMRLSGKLAAKRRSRSGVVAPLPGYMWPTGSEAWMTMGRLRSRSRAIRGDSRGAVGEVKALGVGVEFADAGGALSEAAGGFMDGGVAPGGVDGYERDDAVGMVGGGGQQVVVGGGGDGGVGPAVAHSDGAGDAGGVHSFPQMGGVGQTSAGLGEKGGVGGVPRRQFVVPFRKVGRDDVAVGVDNHTDPIITALITALTIGPIIGSIIGPVTMGSVSQSGGLILARHSGICRGDGGWLNRRNGNATGTTPAATAGCGRPGPGQGRRAGVGGKTGGGCRYRSETSVSVRRRDIGGLT